MSDQSPSAGTAARQVVQVELASDESVRTCWVDWGKRRFKVGDAITLKNSEDAERLWTVLAISAPKDASTVHTDWEVGGINGVNH